MKNFTDFINEELNAVPETQPKAEQPKAEPKGLLKNIEDEELKKKFPIGHKFKYKTKKGDKHDVTVVGYNGEKGNYQVIVNNHSLNKFHPLSGDFEQYARSSEASKLDLEDMVNVFGDVMKSATKLIQKVKVQAQPKEKPLK